MQSIKQYKAGSIFINSENSKIYDYNNVIIQSYR